MTCVEKTIVFPCFLKSTRKSLRRTTLIGSRPENGSSRMRTSGSLDDRPEELDLLLHPLRELFGLLREPGAQVHDVDPLLEAGEGGLLLDALDGGEEEELVDDGHLPVEPALFREVADPFLHLVGEGLAEDLDRPLVGLGDVHRHPDRGRLPGPVRSEQAEGHPEGDLEVEPVDRREFSEALRDSRDRDRRGHPGSPS
jgi:hypothetical protein